VSVTTVDKGPFAIERIAAPLRSQALDRLRRAIIDGELAPGSRLVERDLCARMGVSRTVVREVLRQLESEGLVGMIAHRGPVVRALNELEARELYAIRAVLEGLAARIFVTEATDEQARRLVATVDAVEAAYQRGDSKAVIAAKSSFYAVLFEPARGEVLSAMLASLHARISRWRALGLTHPDRSPQRSAESIAGLRGLAAAIASRDVGEAERRARSEAENAAAEVFRLLRGQRERIADTGSR
jgi:GntR family transcriptional regulator, trigonelline degradation regulator